MQGQNLFSFHSLCAIKSVSCSVYGYSMSNVSILLYCLIAKYLNCPIIVSMLGGVAVGGGTYNPGTGVIAYSGVSCTGSEFFLGDCSRDTVLSTTCTHQQDAGVMCTPGSGTAVDTCRVFPSFFTRF